MARGGASTQAPEERKTEALKHHGEDIENYKKSTVVRSFNASEAQLLEQGRASTARPYFNIIGSVITIDGK